MYACSWYLPITLLFCSEGAAAAAQWSAWPSPARAYQGGDVQEGVSPSSPPSTRFLQAGISGAIKRPRADPGDEFPGPFVPPQKAMHRGIIHTLLSFQPPKVSTSSRESLDGLRQSIGNGSAEDGPGLPSAFCFNPLSIVTSMACIFENMLSKHALSALPLLVGELNEGIGRHSFGAAALLAGWAPDKQRPWTTCSEVGIPPS